MEDRHFIVESSVPVAAKKVNKLQLIQFITGQVITSIEDSKPEAGATLVAALVTSDRLILGHVGDSFAIRLFRHEIGLLPKFWDCKLLNLTHQISRDDEYARIVSHGGTIIDDAVVCHDQCIQANTTVVRSQSLAMTRSIGDMCFKKVGVISEPEYLEIALTKGDVVMLASDFLDYPGAENSQELLRIVSLFANRHLKDASEDSLAQFTSELGRYIRKQWTDYQKTNPFQHVDDGTILVLRPPAAPIKAACPEPVIYAGVSDGHQGAVVADYLTQALPDGLMKFTSGFCRSFEQFEPLPTERILRRICQFIRQACLAYQPSFAMQRSNLMTHWGWLPQGNRKMQSCHQAIRAINALNVRAGRDYQEVVYQDWLTLYKGLYELLFEPYLHTNPRANWRRGETRYLDVLRQFTVKGIPNIKDFNEAFGPDRQQQHLSLNARVAR